MEPGVLLGTEVRPVSVSLLGPVAYDLPLEANNWVEAELNFLVNDRRDVLARWMERGDFYEEFVKSVFREHGIPTDLHYLAMIESGFIPTARSRAGAVGIWQFMPATSRDVSLRVDDLVDERMDPVRSTRAAARHLRSLYRIHGDWALAAAAYNAGSTRINRGLQQYGATNFWDLARRGDLAAETQHYVPRLYAMTIVGRDRQRFGFPPQSQLRTFAFDSIHVDFSVDLEELASMTGVGYDRLGEMNPHLHRGMTPAGGYWVWVPSGTGVEAQRSYIAAARRRDQGVVAAAAPPRGSEPLSAPSLPAPVTSAPPASTRAAEPAAGRAPVVPSTGESLGTYTVRWGDTLSRIVQLSGVSAARIRELNPSIDFDRLQTGARLRLPAAAADVLASRPQDGSGPGPAPAARLAAADALATYTVRWGDTLGRIAQLSGVSGARIRELNPSIDFDRLQTGARIQLPAAAAEQLAASRGEAAGATPASAASPAAARGPSPTAPPSGEELGTYTVRWGDTLGRIAQLSGVSGSRIRELNPSIDFDRLQTGARIRLPSEAAERLTSQAATGQPTQGSSAGGTALSAVARAPAAATAPPRVHEVRAGETLSGIAQRYGVSVAEIQRANSLSGSVIRPGQRLTLPSAGQAGAAGGAGGGATAVEHVVESGETLWGIARRYETSVEAIQEANRLGERPIVPGQKLTVPTTRR